MDLLSNKSKSPLRKCKSVCTSSIYLKYYFFFSHLVLILLVYSHVFSYLCHCPFPYTFKVFFFLSLGFHKSKIFCLLLGFWGFLFILLLVFCILSFRLLLDPFTSSDHLRLSFALNIPSLYPTSEVSLLSATMGDAAE